MASTGVLLASMPYAPLFKPSIGLGLLQAGLRARGIESRCEYAGLEFAARTGVASYLRLSESFPDVVEAIVCFMKGGDPSELPPGATAAE